MSNDSNKPAVDRFHDNISDLAQIIADILGECAEKGCTIVNPVIAQMRANAVINFNKSLVVERFIKYSEKYWPQIKKRNEEFFGEHVGEVFQDLPMGDVNSFKRLLEAKDGKGELIVTPDDREGIWEYFDSFVKIAISFVHENRLPDIKIENGKKSPIWRKNYNPTFTLEKHASLWQVQLKFRKR